MKQAIKGALLSGLVFPGLGQMALKHYPRGLAFLAVAAGCAIHVVKTAVDAVMQSLPGLENGDVANLPVPAGGGDGPVMWLLILCWLWGVLDAYLLGDRLDREPR